MHPYGVIDRMTHPSGWTWIDYKLCCHRHSISIHDTDGEVVVYQEPRSDHYVGLDPEDLIVPTPKVKGTSI